MSDEAVSRRPWYADTRIKIALGIAVAEGLLAAINSDVSKVTIIAIAIPVILFHLFAGRNLESARGRDISWTLAVSQALAAVAVIVSYFIGTLVLILAGVFAAAALYLLWTDRPAARHK
jgi:hypothetical protein